MRIEKLQQVNSFTDLKFELVRELALRIKVYSCELEKYEKGKKYWKSLRQKLGRQYQKLEDAKRIIEVLEKGESEFVVRFSLVEIMEELDREIKMRIEKYPSWNKSDEETKKAVSLIQDTKNIIQMLHIMRVGKQPNLFNQN